ncbi:ImmA/IrrE family metallo-endopeptidase [Candidatus Chlorohelix sp.]|uniref:ImmA/IrrE family metallo-endopeptidase n=1 Tax=Candidatus Chlorohelix sp. TaxID=3139201 RepID=UPI003028CB4E
MAGYRGGRWSSRPNLYQIEERAVKLIGEFKSRLEEVGLEMPAIPPVPVEYVVLTLTDFTVRGVKFLECDGRSLSGLLDPEAGEILYEENESQPRQNFSIAHELGHYYLHYIPALELAQQPTLFELEEEGEAEAVCFFRCDSTEMEEQQDSTLKTILNDTEAQARLAKIIKFKQRAARFEWEANVFASGLLMPRELVQWLNKKHAGDVKGMAQELGVSVSAISYRLNGMGLRQDEFKGVRSRKAESRNSTSGQGTFF